MPFVAVAAAVAIAASVATTVNSFIAAGKQKKQLKRKERAEREHNRISQKREDLKTARERVAAFREARIKRGQLLQGATNAGLGSTGGTSSVQGAEGSISSQLGQNIGQLGQFQGFSQKLSALSQESADALSKFNRIGANAASLNSIFAGVGGIAKTVMAAGGGGQAAGQQAAGGGGAGALT